jgi:nicotinamidase-related amidase
MVDTKKERTALVLCDLQPDILGSLKHRENLLLSLRIPLEAARKNNWSVVYSGLQFKARYEGVSPKHKLYGALCKLNQKLGDKAVHWFMEGWEGSKIISTDPIISPKETDSIVWRSQHVPHELAALLKGEDITKVYIAGAKASGSVQAAAQIIMDHGMDVSAIKECIHDDDEDRLNATIDHLLPVYCDVISLNEMMEDVGGIESYSAESKDVLAYLLSKGDESNDNNILLASDCGRRGHGSRYIQLLQERGGWKTYPTQVWYEDFIHQFRCPLAKKVVDFCDEPEFSKVAMYLSGREYLDEKDKVIEISGRYMPKTYVSTNGKWIGGKPLSDDEDGAIDAPWFIKEADKNLGGSAIAIVGKPSEIMAHIKKDQSYVVQQHIRDPLLTDDGRKAHLKFYVLLMCNDDGETWTLYTYKDALLSISPNVWSPTDFTHDTQITIHRHPEPPGETEGWKQHWDSVYDKCKQATAEVISKAIESGKLKGRRNKKQFEVLSVDWMPDNHGNVWMFEFNLSPAVAQSEFDDPAKRDARRDYLMQHDEIMLREALAIALPWDGGEAPGQWDLAGQFKSSA